MTKLSVCIVTYNEELCKALAALNLGDHTQGSPMASQREGEGGAMEVATEENGLGQVSAGPTGGKKRSGDGIRTKESGVGAEAGMISPPPKHSKPSMTPVVDGSQTSEGNMDASPTPAALFSSSTEGETGQKEDDSDMDSESN